MAAFTVSYRLPSGGLKTEVVDAVDRAAVLAQLKERGITPVSVKEGGSLAAAAKVAAKQPTWIKGAVAGLVVVVAAVIAFFCLMPTEKPAAPKVEKLKKVEKPQVEKVAQKDALKPVPAITPKDIVPAHDSKWGSTAVTADAPVNPNQWPPPKALRDANGRIVPRPESIQLLAQKTTFENPSDDLLAMIVFAKPGQTPPPMPYSQTMERAFLRSLEKPIVVSPDDTDEVRLKKETMMNVRKQVKELMDKGMSFKEVIESEQRRLREDNDTRANVQNEYQRLVRSGDVEGAATYFRRMNIALGQMGIAPIEKSKNVLELRARARERKSANQGENK